MRGPARPGPLPASRCAIVTVLEVVSVDCRFFAVSFVGLLLLLIFLLVMVMLMMAVRHGSVLVPRPAFLKE